MKPTTKSGRGRPAAARNKRKTREELNIEGRTRQRQEKRRGLAAGSRSQEGNKNGGRSATSANADPRIGSKKPVPLIASGAVAKPAAPKVIIPAEVLSPQAELDSLENDTRLDALLIRLEQDEILSAEEQAYVDEKLDRIDQLMTELGIELDDEDEEEETKNEDMLQLLKRGFEKDSF
ncbi:Der GTPase-activating protein YihI [Sodalis ligni]|uniref:Der GTPase-activating protein YihI n=1 Tax=Sodalis ligni TaxID=2697027 RepID=UPI001BDEFF37|nr:Der GTPase-activating protein YihI [Sodalis ligni]